MKFFIETLRKLGMARFLALSVLCSGAAFAQDVPVEPAMFKGDIAWMMTATLLVTFMAVPGLALFYGGLVRTKNAVHIDASNYRFHVDRGSYGQFMDTLWL